MAGRSGVEALLELAWTRWIVEEGEVVDDITCIAVDVHARKTAAAQLPAWPQPTPPPSPPALRPATDGSRETCAIT